MQFAVGILMAFMIIEFLWKLLGPIVGLVFHALSSAVLAVGAGWIGGLVTLAILEQRRIAQLTAQHVLGTFMNVSVDSGAVVCRVDDGRLARAIAEASPGRTVAFVCLLTGACTVGLLASGGAFDELPVFNRSRFQASTGLFLTAILTVCMLIPVLSRLAAARSFATRARSAVEDHAARIRSISAAGLEELRQAAAAVSKLCGTLGLPTADAYAGAVADFVQRNPGKILSQPDTLETVVREQFQHARADARHLEQAAVAHEDATRELAEARLEVARTRSMAMFRLLDELDEAQTQLKGHLLARDWRAYHDGLANLMSYVADVRAAARSGEGQEAPEQETVAQDVSDPYVILRASPEMSLQDIEAIARRLMNIYHPDKGLVKDDSHFKQIQGAWEAIKAQRSR